MAEKLTENTIIGEAAVSPERYRTFFRKAIEGFSPEVHCGEFKYWLSLNNGKTIKEAITSYRLSEPQKSIEERLTEERFSIISEPDKAFILAFSKNISELNYDCGGHIGWGACWGRYMVIYSKLGTKSKQVAARIFIRDDGIVLRLFFNNVDKHTQYIENAPEHIKSVFIGTHGDCNCSPKKENCKMRKTYAINGKQIEKCSGVVFEFHQPDIMKLPDYLRLLREFYGRAAK
ncbi:MAG: hypothetical protein FWH01_10125 [Oscillospiraceae bacterium]|nr:hypothetical protein [Oscillospiraceae bacterium]